MLADAWDREPPTYADGQTDTDTDRETWTKDLFCRAGVLREQI